MYELLRFVIWLSFALTCVPASWEPQPTPYIPNARVAPRNLEVITVTIDHPAICTINALQYSTKLAIPTGQVQIFPDQTVGWGTTGSIWNFTLDDGAGFSQLSAPCQGSSCTGIEGNQQQSGQIFENPDGVWTLNVTTDMAPSVTISGIIINYVTVNVTVNKTFDLSITSTPPCDLPLAENCTLSRFNISAEQWQAYSVDSWLLNYCNENDLQDLDHLYNKLASDLLTPSEADALVCEPDSVVYTCVPPNGPELQQLCPSIDTTRGILALWAVMRLSAMLYFLWTLLASVGSGVQGMMATLISAFIKPVEKQKWESIVSAASSVIGVMVFLAILLQVLFPEAAWAAYAVVAVVGITNAMGAASNYANGFQETTPDDTYLIYEGNFDDMVSAYTNLMQTSVISVWAPTNHSALGPTQVSETLSGGAWIEVPDPFNATHLGDNAKVFFETLLVTSIINGIWKSRDNFYIVFVPYGIVENFQVDNTTHTGPIRFTKDNCTQHWANDPNRPNYIACDMQWGAQAGMAVLTQPSSNGTSTISAFQATFSESTINFTYSNDDVLQSSLSGNAQYGFNYNFTSDQLKNLLVKGDINLNEDFTNIPGSTPGLYNLDVCVVTNLSYVPGAWQYLRSNPPIWPFGGWFYPDPCICATFESQGQKFAEHASPNVTEAVTGDCMSEGRYGVSTP